MAGRINDEDIQTLKERLDIVEVIQPYTALKRSGGGFMGRCPFHDEKSASFSVRPNYGYHCFGCGVGGDAIKFVQEIEGLSFVEAVERLARQCGVTLRYQEMRPGQRKALGRRTRLMELIDSAASFYREQLRGPTGAAVRDYLASRQVPQEAWDVFGLGWAPDAWDDLTQHLITKGAKAEDLIAAGLASEGRHGPLDRFRARLLFPIRDQRGGEVIAFGGRILPGGPVVTKMDGTAPKYINSPTTEVYDKSTTLYGLDLARREIVKRKEVVVVEGYMDVVALHVAGLSNAVAPCGTSLTEQHFTMMQRMDARVTLSLDADRAGFDAAERARERASSAGVTDLGVLVLPEGQDPADLATAGGMPAIDAALGDRKTAVEFQIEYLLGVSDLSTPEARTDAYRSVLPLLGSLQDSATRYAYVHDVLSPTVSVPSQRIEDELNAAYPIRNEPSFIPGLRQQPRDKARQRVVLGDPQMQLERQVLQAALQLPDELPDDWHMLDESVFTAEPSRILFRAINAHRGAFEKILDAMPDDDMRSRVRGLAAAELTIDATTAQVALVIDALRARDAQRRWADARTTLQDGGEHLDADERRRLMRDIGELERVWRAYERRDIHQRGVQQ
ncbi:MAG: DNA primase [Euzebya sp.]